MYWTHSCTEALGHLIVVSNMLNKGSFFVFCGNRPILIILSESLAPLKPVIKTPLVFNKAMVSFPFGEPPPR